MSYLKGPRYPIVEWLGRPLFNDLLAQGDLNSFVRRAYMEPDGDWISLLGEYLTIIEYDDTTELGDFS